MEKKHPTLKTCAFILLLMPSSLLSQKTKSSLPPIFPNVDYQTQFDNRIRAYISPTRIIWKQNEELIEGAENLLLSGNGQATTAKTPQCVFNSKDGKRPSILLDFGRELQGGLQFVTSIRDSKNPVKIRVRLGESASEAMSDISLKGTATNDHAMREYSIELPWLGVCEIGNSGFRFVRIDLMEDNVVLPIKEIRAILVYQDVPYLGSFHSSNPRLDSIWMTGAYTVHLNMQEYLVEAAKRDRLVWVGDLQPEVKAVLAVFGDNKSIARSLDFARNETPLPNWMNGMCSYSLWWVLIHRDYFMYRGDLKYLKVQQVYLSQLLRILIKTIDKNGREHLEGGGRFLDWPTSVDKKSIDAGLHALMIMTLDAGAQMLEALGDKTLADSCIVTSDKMKKFIPEYESSKQSAALIALSGIVSADKVNKEVISKGGVSKFSTFYGYYMLEAKAKAGDFTNAINNISVYWGAMIDLGATTFWEDFNIDWLKNASRIDELVSEGKVDVHATYGDFCYKGFRNSLCHGWAAGPTPWLSEYVLGISIVEPGCKVIRIDPHLGNLQWVEGSFPTPYGLIKVRHEKQPDGTIKSKIEAPKKIKIIR
jgi:alpha-L-rhamnosidase